MLALAIFYIRDPAAVWTLSMSTIALLIVVTNLLTNRQKQVNRLIIESGVRSWLITGLCCLVPTDQGLLLNRFWASVVLGLSSLFWILVIFILRSERSGQSARQQDARQRDAGQNE
jgi:hypothetical protein